MTDAEHENRSDWEATARQDWERVVGKVVGYYRVTGYKEGDSQDFFSDGEPFLMLVEPGILGDLKNWQDDWLDPYWSLAPAVARPELQGAGSFWSYGPSYNLHGLRPRDTGSLVLDDDGQVRIFDVPVYTPLGEVTEGV